MSFNLDDPLAGILSDGSDDSFFDDDILGKKKPAKKKGSTPTAEKKNALFDLEDIDETKPIADTKNDSLFVFDKKPPETAKINVTSPAPVKRTVSKESINVQTIEKTKPVLGISKSPAKANISASADKLDFLKEPKKDVAKPSEKGKSSQSLFDDILGGSSTKTGESSQARPATAAKSDFDFDSFLGKSESKQTLSSNKNVAQKSNIKSDNPKENQPKKKSSEDWLGIFQDKEPDVDETDAGMPSWLVSSDTKKKVNERKSQKKLITAEVAENTKEDQIEDHQKENETQGSNLEQLKKGPDVASSAILQGSNEDITAEGATLYLQQQESQLMVALQLKAQEDKLVAMQMRQKDSQRVQREAALAQHAQVDAMLQRQAENRQQMQAIIAAHQERITQRIKALLGTQDTYSQDINDHTDGNDNSKMEQRETPHAREKKQLLQLVQSLQENHDKEIDLMESSYRRQLAFLEVSLSQFEERMKEESDKLVKFYTEKITWLEEHHQMYKKLTEDNLSELNERHKTENEMLRQQHLENVRVLQEHHAGLMENIKNAVKQEQALIQDSAGFSSDLHELVVNVKENRSQCQLLLEKVQVLTENTQRDVERSLQAREVQINDMIQQLKKEKDNFEIEKSEGRDMVRMLETRLKQMTTMMEEESAILKQKKMEFEFEKATFSKQTEFAKNMLKKQDEDIKMLREDIQKEYQEKIGKIDDERNKVIKESAAIAKDKASVQGLKQELEKMKAELQAQLEEMTEERSKLNIEKQQTHMEEQRMLAKSRDLDLLAKTAIDKQSQADKKYSEAEFLQRKYEERIRRIQEHVVSLNSREKQIAREKVALSRERLNIHNQRKQMESRQQCSLCKSTQNYNYETTYTLPESFLNVPVARDYGNANVDSAMSAIEAEMAHLMSRNFNLKHRAGIENVENERRSGDDNLQNTQASHMESGAFKDYMDPKFMMLRLDVQNVLNNIDQSKKAEQIDEEE